MNGTFTIHIADSLCSSRYVFYGIFICGFLDEPVKRMFEACLAMFFVKISAVANPLTGSLIVGLEKKGLSDESTHFALLSTSV